MVNMIPEFISSFMAQQFALRAWLSQAHPDDYLGLVTKVVELIGPPLDPERIHMIDDGHYQGVQLFVIAEQGYQPSDYWVTHNYYGSCSG